MEPFEDWKSRVGRDNPGDRAKARWYSQFQPDHPLIQLVAERRVQDRANAKEKRASLHASRVAADAERSRLFKSNETRQLKRNLDFQARLHLGLMLGLKIDDAAEYKHLPCALEHCSTIPELEKYCIMRDTIDRRWLSEILPQVTHNNYCVATDMLNLFQQISEAVPTAEINVALLSECEAFEYVEDLVITDGIVPTHVRGHLVLVETPSVVPDGYLVIEHNIHFTRSNCKQCVVKSTVPILGFESVEIDDLPTYELLSLGPRICASPYAQHMKLGIWKEWSRTVRQRLVPSTFVMMCITSGGLQRLAALSLIRFTVECAVPRNHHKLVDYIMAAFADIPP